MSPREKARASWLRRDLRPAIAVLIAAGIWGIYAILRVTQRLPQRYDGVTSLRAAVFVGAITAVLLVLGAVIKRRDAITVGGAVFDLRLTVAFVLGIVLPMLVFYGHKFFGHRAYDQFVFFLVIPVAFIVFAFRQDPREYGLGLGRWKEGLIWTVVGIAIMAPILWYLGTHDPAMRQYYRVGAERSTGMILWEWGVEMFAWEFIWRGFYLAALLRVMGPGPAILLQGVPFAFMHMGKPEFEALSTPIGGTCFAFVAWRTRAFWPAFLIHWFMIVFLELAARGRLPF